MLRCMQEVPAAHSPAPSPRPLVKVHHPRTPITMVHLYRTAPHCCRCKTPKGQAQTVQARFCLLFQEHSLPYSLLLLSFACSMLNAQCSEHLLAGKQATSRAMQPGNAGKAYYTISSTCCTSERVCACACACSKEPEDVRTRRVTENLVRWACYATPCRASQHVLERLNEHPLCPTADVLMHCAAPLFPLHRRTYGVRSCPGFRPLSGDGWVEMVRLSGDRQLQKSGASAACCPFFLLLVLTYKPETDSRSTYSNGIYQSVVLLQAEPIFFARTHTHKTLGPQSVGPLGSTPN